MPSLHFVCGLFIENRYAERCSVILSEEYNRPNCVDHTAAEGLPRRRSPGPNLPMTEAAFPRRRAYRLIGGRSCQVTQSRRHEILKTALIIIGRGVLPVTYCSPPRQRFGFDGGYLSEPDFVFYPKLGMGGGCRNGAVVVEFLDSSLV